MVNFPITIDRTNKGILKDSAILTSIIIISMLLVFLPAIWSIRLVLYSTFMILAIIRPVYILYLLPPAIAFGSLDQITVSGLNLTAADILVGLLVFGYLLHRYILHTTTFHKISPSAKKLFFVLVLFIFAALLSFYPAISMKASLKELFKWVEFGIIFVIGTQLLKSKKALWGLIISLMITAATEAAIGYVQSIFLLGPSSFILAGILRAYGTFDQPNPYAGYLNLTLPIAISLFLLHVEIKKKYLNFGIAAFLAGALYLSNSRGAFISIAIASIVLILLAAPVMKPWLMLGLLAAPWGLLFWALGFIPNSLMDPFLKEFRVSDLSLNSTINKADFSTLERLAHWVAGLRMFNANPILGVGFGNYSNAYPEFLVPGWQLPLGHAHNYFINIAAETGIAGLSTYVLLIISIFILCYQAYRKVKAGDKELRRYADKYFTGKETRSTLALLIGAIAAIVTMQVHNIFDDLYVHSMIIQLGLLLVIIECSPNFLKSASPDKESTIPEKLT